MTEDSVEHDDDRTGQTSRLLAALGRLIRTSRAASQHQQAEYGLSGTPLGILKALADGDARPGDLALALQISPSVVSRAVVPLEQGGLVERRTDPSDARASRLGLTDPGRRRLAEARQTFVDRFAPLLDDWDPAEGSAVTRLMSRLEETIGTGVDLRAAAAREHRASARRLSTAS